MAPHVNLVAHEAAAATRSTTRTIPVRKPSTPFAAAAGRPAAIVPPAVTA